MREDLGQEWGEDILAQLQVWGREFGFSQIGVSDTDLSSAEPGLLAWLAAGFHGEMDYMARHGLKRARPAELLPCTLRVITARMDYLPPQTPQGWQAMEWQGLQRAGHGQVSIYARGRDYHRVLRPRLQRLGERLAQALRPHGFRAFTDSAPVLEVALAVRSGLGWRGKHTLLIDRAAGSTFFLGEIYTDLPLPTTAPVSAHCGLCRACLDACPTGAIVEEGRVDARRCISYLNIEHPGAIPEALRRPMGLRLYGCDDCQLACPWNKYAQPAVLADFSARAPWTSPRLESLWAWSAADFERHTEGSPIRRIGFERWQRNLAVVTGNSLAQVDDPGLRRAMQAAWDAATPLVREHMVWALQPPGHSPAMATQTGMETMPSTVDTVISPATKGPSPPMRTASTKALDAVGKAVKATRVRR